MVAHRPPGRARTPSRFAEVVAGRLRKRQLERHLAGRGQLDGAAEMIFALHPQKDENFIVYLENALAPGEILVCAGEF